MDKLLDWLERQNPRNKRIVGLIILIIYFIALFSALVYYFGPLLYILYLLV
jgi:hypothetical protein